MKHHKRVLYVNLLTFGKLYKHLREIYTAATEQQQAIIEQMKAARDVTEQLKEKKTNALGRHDEQYQSLHR